MADDNQNQGDQGQQGNASPVRVEQFLAGIDYPKSKQDLIEYARQNGAGEEVIKVLEGLPDQQYTSVTDVSQAVGQRE